MRKYKIYMMSARNIISYAEKDSDGIFKFNYMHGKQKNVRCRQQVMSRKAMHCFIK